MEESLSIVERIRSNDETLTELRLTEAPVAYCTSTTEFFDALSVNKVIDYIRVDRDFLPCMIGGDKDITAFFNALGKIPSLKEVHIWHAAFSVSCLLGFLNTGITEQKLDLLEFGCLELSGTTQDFHTVATALQNHTTLRIFHMVDFSLSYRDVENNENIIGGGSMNSLDTIVESLATMPALEVVKLEVTSSRRRSLCGSEAAAIRPRVQLSGTALALLLQKSISIREIQLNRITLQKQDYEILAVALQNAPSSFKSLSLPHCDIDDDACAALAVALPTCQLEKIDFSCNKLTDEGCILIASALKENTSVKMLRLWGNVKISNAGFDALLEMLQVNCHLERVPLMAPFDYGTKIDAALLKNRCANAPVKPATNRAA